MKKILLIEDDKDIVELVKYNLEKDGFNVAASADGASGLAQLRKSPPDLLLLDLMLPKVSGLEICKEVRKDVTLNRLPVLILTAKGEEADRVVGLELGADDYVTKPFSPRELVARVKALLRRAEPATAPEKLIEIGMLKIDPAAYRVTRAGKPVPMSTLEFRLLYFWPPVRTGSSRAINCWMAFGEPSALSLPVVWTCTCDDCVRRLKPSLSIPLT